MKNSAKILSVAAYLQKHWFKLTFLVIVLYFFIQKDISFSVNLNSPEEKKSMQADPTNYDFNTASKKETFTERKKKTTKILDKFEMPSFFGNMPKNNPMDNLNKVEDNVKHDYLKRFARVVINERRKFGIPSSILLANGLLQSQAGQRNIAKQANNHFALTCTAAWEGNSKSYHGICYRQYENAWTSYRNHSAYLTSGKFAPLVTLESTDYKAWANGLEQLDYGNIDNLAQHLVEIIEQYGLADLDKR